MWFEFSWVTNSCTHKTGALVGFALTPPKTVAKTRRTKMSLVGGEKKKEPYNDIIGKFVCHSAKKPMVCRLSDCRM
jgi:hypothetical protein